MTIRKIGMAAAFGAALAGCISVKSDYVDYSSGDRARGLHYAAPKGVIRVELLEQGGELFLAVSEPFFIGDPEATFTIKGAAGLFADQDYRLVVDPATRLLEHASSVSEGRAGDIAVNIARAVSGIGALSAESTRDVGETVIYAKVVDPFSLQGCDFATSCGFESVNNELRIRALEHLGCGVGGEIDYPDMCGRLESTPDFFSISLDPMFFAAPSDRDRARTSAARCDNSICYRAPVPYSLGVRVKGVTDAAELVLMPNEAPVASITVPAGFFADARSRVTLYNGMPAIYEVDKDNELAAATLLPLSIIQGMFAAASEVFQFRINYNVQREQLLDSETQIDEAEDRRDAFLREREERLAELEELEALRELEEANLDDGSDLIGDVAESSRRAGPRAESSRLESDPHGQAEFQSNTGEASGFVRQATDRLFKVPIGRLDGGPASAFSGADLQ
ncbi:MAG: hypothetical protein AAFX03_02835 [Pseudomonadota bacterium]